MLASNIEEFERLSRMIADMLFLAKADEGQLVPSKKPIALGVMAEVFELRPYFEWRGLGFISQSGLLAGRGSSAKTSRAAPASLAMISA